MIKWLWIISWFIILLKIYFIDIEINLRKLKMIIYKDAKINIKIYEEKLYIKFNTIFQIKKKYF